MWDKSLVQLRHISADFSELPEEALTQVRAWVRVVQQRGCGPLVGT